MDIYLSNDTDANPMSPVRSTEEPFPACRISSNPTIIAGSNKTFKYNISHNVLTFADVAGLME